MRQLSGRRAAFRARPELLPLPDHRHARHALREQRRIPINRLA